MSFDASILSDGFLDMQSSPPADEDAAIDKMADTLVAYFKTAAADGTIDIVPAAVDAQLTTIKGNLAGMKTTGPTAIQLACVQFWTGVIASPSTFFVGCAPPAVLSTSLSTIAALMLSEAATSIADELVPEDACQALADAIESGHISVPSTVTLTAGPTVVTIE